MFVCLLTNKHEIRDPHKFIKSVMVYVHIMLIFHGNIHVHGNN